MHRTFGTKARVAAGLLAVASIGALATPASAAPASSSSVQSSVPDKNARYGGDYNYSQQRSCGGMNVWIRAKRQGSSLWVWVSDYNFADNGRSSGNTKLSLHWPEGATGQADFGSVIQDGQWHGVDVSRQAISTSKQVEARVELVYDKAWASDPKCTVSFFGL